MSLRCARRRRHRRRCATRILGTMGSHCTAPRLGSCSRADGIEHPGEHCLRPVHFERAARAVRRGRPARSLPNTAPCGERRLHGVQDGPVHEHQELAGADLVREQVQLGERCAHAAVDPHQRLEAGSLLARQGWPGLGARLPRCLDEARHLGAGVRRQRLQARPRHRDRSANQSVRRRAGPQHVRGGATQRRQRRQHLLQRHAARRVGEGSVAGRRAAVVAGEGDGGRRRDPGALVVAGAGHAGTERSVLLAVRERRPSLAGSRCGRAAGADAYRDLRLAAAAGQYCAGHRAGRHHLRHQPRVALRLLRVPRRHQSEPDAQVGLLDAQPVPRWLRHPVPSGERRAGRLPRRSAHGRQPAGRAARIRPCPRRLHVRACGGARRVDLLRCVYSV